MPVDRPIFIVSPPRTGTSLLYRCLCTHPDVGYFNRANRKYPRHPRLAFLLTRLGLYGDRPRESHRIWERFYKGPDGDVMGPEHATREARQWYEGFIDRVLRARGATRFAAKLPSFSVRIPWLDALFPDALFLVTLRDWRAALASAVIKRERDCPGGSWFGVMPRGWKEREKEPPELGGAWMFRTAYEAIEEEERARPGRFLRVWYEDLCTDPAAVMEGVLGFCGLRWSGAVKAALPGDIRPSSNRWKERGIPSPEMTERILEAHGEALRRYEYPKG